MVVTCDMAPPVTWPPCVAPACLGAMVRRSSRLRCSMPLVGSVGPAWVPCRHITWCACCTSWPSAATTAAFTGVHHHCRRAVGRCLGHAFARSPRSSHSPARGHHGSRTLACVSTLLSPVPLLWSVSALLRCCRCPRCAGDQLARAHSTGAARRRRHGLPPSRIPSHLGPTAHMKGWCSSPPTWRLTTWVMSTSSSWATRQHPRHICICAVVGLRALVALTSVALHLAGALLRRCDLCQPPAVHH